MRIGKVLIKLRFYSPATLVADRRIYLTPFLKYLTPIRREPSESDLTDPEAESRLWHYEATPVRAAHELLKLSLRVRRLLPHVVCPALIIHSTRDTAIHPRSARTTYDRLGSIDKRLVTLHNSGHCLTVSARPAAQ